MKKALVTLLAVLAISGLATAATRTATFDSGTDGWTYTGVVADPATHLFSQGQANILSGDYQDAGSPDGPTEHSFYTGVANGRLETDTFMAQAHEGVDMEPDFSYADRNLVVNTATDDLAASGLVNASASGNGGWTMAAGWFNDDGYGIGLYSWPYNGTQYILEAVTPSNPFAGYYNDGVNPFANAAFQSFAAGTDLDFTMSYDASAQSATATLTDGVTTKALVYDFANAGRTDVAALGNLTNFGMNSLLPNQQNNVIVQFMDLDDVTYTVPEPATMSLLGLGGLGALIRRRRA